MLNNFKKSISRYINNRKLHPVSIKENEENIKMFLRFGNTAYPITNSHALISLKPFAIAINADGIKDFPPARPILVLMDGNKNIGKLNLRFDKTWQFNNLTLGIYEAHMPVSSYSMKDQLWDSFILRIKNITDKRAKNFIVPPGELLKLFIYTLKPRPVYLISIKHENGFDAFPIDILGKISANRVLLSIRTTSPAIKHILQTKQLCASSVPVSSLDTIYKLGRHHVNGVLPENFKSLGFIESEKFKIPIPYFAISVRELMLEDSFTKGVHTQFLCKVVNSYQLNNGAMATHTPWFNKKYFSAN